MAKQKKPKSRGTKPQSRSTTDARIAKGESAPPSSSKPSAYQRLVYHYVGPILVVTLILWLTSSREEVLVQDKPLAPSSDADSCQYVMAVSTLPNAGWGVFSLKDKKRDDPILYSDLIVHLPDMLQRHYDGLAHLLQNYTMQATLGGQAEGAEVAATSPGLGMLSNTNPHDFNAVPNHPVAPDPADLVRGTAGCGSSTLYHHRQFFAQKPIPAGSEILINYGAAGANGQTQKTKNNPMQSIDHLSNEGICLDNIRSEVSAGKGRGAFATRFLKSGSIVTPLPVLPVNRTSLSMTKKNGTDKFQLLLNYCLGHPNSTLLLYPYSPVSNYINHADNPGSINAVIQWSDRSYDLETSLAMNAADILSSRRWGLLLEVVAIRDIFEGEEILIDYGDEWRVAWDHHRATFDPALHGNAQEYTYVSRFFPAKMIRTVDEQKEDPYPSNMITSCYYRYAGADVSLWPDTSFDTKAKVTTAEWVWSKEIMSSFYVRPCNVLERGVTDDRYTVEIMNPIRTIAADERIPSGERHIVTGVHRTAILITEKPYSTDQNLPNAFRHEIGLPAGIFPDTWLDLKREGNA